MRPSQKSHSFVWQLHQTSYGQRRTLRRVNGEGQLLKRVRCSKKVQLSARRAGLPNPKWQIA